MSNSDNDIIYTAVYMICKEFVDLVDDPSDIHTVDGYTLEMARLYIKRYLADHPEVKDGKET